MIRAAAARLEKSKSSLSGGGTAFPEAGAPLEDGSLPFSVESRRGNFYLGNWVPANPAGEHRLFRWDFEIFSELEPEAALEFRILYSRDLGF
jgi:hypothetical protein